MSYELDRSPVERNEGRDAPRQAAFAEQMPRASQVAFALFADGGHEGYRAAQPDLGRIERLNQPDQRRQPRRVVGYAGRAQPRTHAAHSDIRPFGKDRVHVRRQRQQRLLALAAIKTDHVACAVGVRVGQTQLGESRGDVTPALTLLEWRRRNFADAYQLGGETRMRRFDEIEGASDPRVTQ